jgi:hypothetical protein
LISLLLSFRYDPLSALKFTTTKVPSFSMGAKFRTIDRDPYFVEPAKDGKAVIPPAVKTLIGSSGPKYSMSGKTRQPRGMDEGPAPGSYPGVNQDLVGKSGPRFSMGARVRKGVNYGHWGDEPRLRETPRG